jgi:hypothetical protein
MKIAAGLTLYLLLTACSDKLSVEQHIIANLRNMETAAEQGEHFEFMDYVSESFNGQYGSLDRRGFHRFMIFQLNQNRRLHAQFFPIKVQEVSSNQASAQFSLLVTGGVGLLPDRGQFFNVKTQWLYINDEWLLDNAEWEVAQLPDSIPGKY